MTDLIDGASTVQAAPRAGRRSRREMGGLNPRTRTRLIAEGDRAEPKPLAINCHSARHHHIYRIADGGPDHPAT